MTRAAAYAGMALPQEVENLKNMEVSYTAVAATEAKRAVTWVMPFYLRPSE